MAEDEQQEESLVKRMRLATREIHNISDTLVNLKVAYALSDNRVWGDGLLVFYEIFRFLECNVSTDILPIEYHRTKAFESDIEYYLGDNWKRNYKIRSTVQEYLNYLTKLSNTNSNLLIPYVYHLYLGLLSGGQILQKKMQLTQRLRTAVRLPTKNQNDNNTNNNNNNGSAVTNFGGEKIGNLKNHLKKHIDEITKSFDEETKCQLVNESKIVFQLNNKIIASVRQISLVNYKIVLILIVVIIIVFYLYHY